jgi:hypothetical protein
MTNKVAIKIASDYVREHFAYLDVQYTPSCKLIPAQYRPELDASDDAWFVSFPYSNSDNLRPNQESLRLLINVRTGEVTIPKML